MSSRKSSREASRVTGRRAGAHPRSPLPWRTGIALAERASPSDGGIHCLVEEGAVGSRSRVACFHETEGSLQSSAGPRSEATQRARNHAPDRSPLVGQVKMLHLFTHGPSVRDIAPGQPARADSSDAFVPCHSDALGTVILRAAALAATPCPGGPRVAESISDGAHPGSLTNTRR